MFSFVGDTVFDPFLGTGTTSIAAAMWGRNSIGVEVDEHYFDMAVSRITNHTNRLFSSVQIKIHDLSKSPKPGKQVAAAAEA
jgi:DNA modification methylase